MSAGPCQAAVPEGPEAGLRGGVVHAGMKARGHLIVLTRVVGLEVLAVAESESLLEALGT